MPKGGARTKSGPPPDPNALSRERDAGEWFVLPAAGRAGDPPEWPLVEPTERELELWARLWAKPQALMWQRLGLEFEVAIYTRRLGEAELAESKVNLSTLLRQMSDSLGLTTPGMRANRWRIEAAPDSPSGKSSSQSEEKRPSARDRYRVIDGGRA